MKKKSLFSLFLKIMGIYSFIQAIILLQSFGMFITIYSKLDTENVNILAMYIGVLLPSCLLLSLFFILLFFSERISTKVIGSDESVDVLTALTSKEVQALAFSIVGVVFFLLGIVNIVRHGSIVLLTFQQVGGIERILDYPSVLGFLFQIILGMVLFSGAKPLAIFWHRLKYELDSGKKTDSRLGR